MSKASSAVIADSAQKGLPEWASSKSATLMATSAFVILLVLYPVAMLAIGSVDMDAAREGGLAAALRGYTQLIVEYELLWNSAVVATGATVVALLFGVPLAWITTRTNIPFRSALEQLILIPFYLTPLLGAVGWVMLGSPGQAGILNATLMSLIGPMGNIVNIYSPGGIIWVMGIYFAPFCYLFAAGALRSMEPALEECSQVLGGNQLRTALSITLPLIKPAVVGSSLLVFVLAIGQFGVPAVLGMPRGYHVLTTRIYEYVAGISPNFPAAAAMGLSLTLVTALGVFLQLKILGKQSYTTVSGRGFRPRQVDVTGWKVPLFCFAMLYIAAAVILPLGAMIYASLLRWTTTDLAVAQFTLDNYRYILSQYPPTWVAIKNSLVLGFLASFATVGLAVMVTWILHRTKLPIRGLLEQVVMVPLAVPAVVFSVGLLWAWIRFPLFNVYGTIWILFICYVTIFLPYGVRTISATLVQIDRSLEECASVMGAGWTHILRTITLPLLAPGLWAAWTLLFVSVLKELTASALLYNSKTVVLSVAVFDLYVGSSFNRVATLSLIQAAILFLVLFLVRTISRRVGVSPA